MRRNALLTVSTLALILFAASAVAQAAPPAADSLKVDYFEYAHTAGVPDGTLRLTNPGTTGTDMCAAIYVFEPNQEMMECCSCLVSPNGLRTLSVNTDLTNNPIVGHITLTTGSISIVSTPTVSAACPLPTTLAPASGGVRAWVSHMDHLRSGTTGGFLGSVAVSPDATFSSGQQELLQTDCTDISLVGTGAGVCTCGTGD